MTRQERRNRKVKLILESYERLTKKYPGASPRWRAFNARKRADVLLARECRAVRAKAATA